MTDAPAIHTIQLTGTGVFNDNTMAAFHAELDAVEANDAIAAVFITGEGKNFSQGLDLEYLMANPDTFPDFVVRTMHMVGRLLTLPVPVVSLVNGHAFGLGAMIVVGSDYAVMRRDRGYWCLPEVDIGMTMSTRMNALLTTRLPLKTVRDTMFTGARIGGEQAVALGIVDAAGEANDLETLAREICAPMLGKPRHLLAGLKHGVNKPLLELFYSDADDGPYGVYERPV